MIHRVCDECGRQVAVRPNGLLRAHPATPRVGYAWDRHCTGSGAAAVSDRQRMCRAYHSIDGWITLNAELAMVGACRSILAKLTALHGDARDDPRMHLLPSERVRVLTSPAIPGEDAAVTEEAGR